MLGKKGERANLCSPSFSLHILGCLMQVVPTFSLNSDSEDGAGSPPPLSEFQSANPVASLLDLVSHCSNGLTFHNTMQSIVDISGHVGTSGHDGFGATVSLRSSVLAVALSHCIHCSVSVSVIAHLFPCSPISCFAKALRL